MAELVSPISHSKHHFHKEKTLKTSEMIAYSRLACSHLAKPFKCSGENYGLFTTKSTLPLLKGWGGCTLWEIFPHYCGNFHSITGLHFCQVIYIWEEYVRIVQDVKCEAVVCLLHLMTRSILKISRDEWGLSTQACKPPLPHLHVFPFIYFSILYPFPTEQDIDQQKGERLPCYGALPVVLA